MITPGEIQKMAQKAGVRDRQIEKDYVLSWILQGIAHHELLPGAIVFKGGTVLKKAYFKDYRFSEDLDFTILDDAVSNEQIFEWFEQVFEFTLKAANIPLEIVADNAHEAGGINFFIGYVGPLGGFGTNKKVKVDISRSEKLAFDTVVRKIHLAYSDQAEHQLRCYALEEVLLEKLRSVMQRMQARDFYDIWYLLEIQGMAVNFYINEFQAKCESKGLDASDFPVKLKQRLPQYKARWEKSMVAQIQGLPEFDQVEREVLRRLKKLERE